jgi:hypothetical protein
MAKGDTFDRAFDNYAAWAGLGDAGVDVAALKAFVVANAVPKARVAPLLTGLRDDLAAIEHDRWGHWQRYMHGQCRAQQSEPGALVIPATLVKQWSRQANTRFDELTPKEKESDREQVDRYLPLLIERLSA